jgi:hypothetical protein
MRSACRESGMRFLLSNQRYTDEQHACHGDDWQQIEQFPLHDGQRFARVCGQPIQCQCQLLLFSIRSGLHAASKRRIKSRYSTAPDSSPIFPN